MPAEPEAPPIIITMLRLPRMNNPFEMRTDPLWEFGSFGCTGCHRRNLMNPKRLAELDGARLAFAQNGPLGVKLVHLTPPVKTRQHPRVGEVNWQPADMPLSYESAPILINNAGYSDFPGLLAMIASVRRFTPIAQFSSKFRSRRAPLPEAVGREMAGFYDAFRMRDGKIAQNYVDALPCAPPKVDRDRLATYQGLLGFDVVG